MNEEQGLVTHDRSAWTARFFSRLHRYRNLFRRRWWVLVVCMGAGAGGHGRLHPDAPPEYVSAGQMIVSMRLNIQQGSLYSEDLNNFLGTQAALMQGSEVQQRAHDRVASQNPGLLAQTGVAERQRAAADDHFCAAAPAVKIRNTPRCFSRPAWRNTSICKKEMAERTSSTTIAGLTDQMLRLEPQLQKCDDEMQSFLATNDAALLQEASGVGSYLVASFTSKWRPPSRNMTCSSP